MWDTYLYISFAYCPHCSTSHGLEDRNLVRKTSEKLHKTYLKWSIISRDAFVIEIWHTRELDTPADAKRRCKAAWKVLRQPLVGEIIRKCNQWIL